MSCCGSCCGIGSGCRIAEIPSVCRSGRGIHATALNLRLKLDPSALGANNGDRIGVQLLYCPQGWNWVGIEAGKALLEKAESGQVLPRLSNRAEFILP